MSLRGHLRVDRPMLAMACAMAGFLAWAAAPAYAVGGPSLVSALPLRGGFALVEKGKAAPLIVSGEDWPGVLRAAGDLRDDIQRVTGILPAEQHDVAQGGAVNAVLVDAVLVGTLGRSPLIDELVRRGKLDVRGMRGEWEAGVTAVVEQPLPGVRRALVIAGSDKRGTIFGLYALSEAIGVSPWYWWADVRVPHHEALYVTPGVHRMAPPAVKYRGIFLNDEAPSLSNYVQEKFGGYNQRFYVHVFELLLRLRANYLWPAMWNNAFNEDDPADPKLADEYGIVMGTSHHEPMLRAQQEWKRHGTGPWDYTTNAGVLDDFWARGIERNKEYESTITIGMRGDGDMAMSATANTALLERIVAEQRKIIAAHADPKVRNPQIWALYKEVQEYYEKGMRVPDDVTLLWCDDNWGNLRRLPTAEERSRPGGAGIYYHFDYVGDPRSYKWLNTYSITKVWEQMHLALEYGADRVWIVNVGDLKPMEFPIEFFLTMARAPGLWGKDRLQQYTVEWATREFGPEHAAEIAELVATYTKFNGRRKPEQLDPATYSLTTDHEAERVDQAWRELTDRAERLYATLPEAQQASFFELVLYPLKASAIVGEIYIAAGRNRLYARQGRPSANFYAEETRRLFAEDAALTDEYNHKLLNGKWDHMMDQTHIGYTFWNEPPLNAMPAVQQVQPLQTAQMAVFAEGSEAFRPALPVFDAVNRQSHAIEVVNRGTEPFEFSARASAPWILLTESGGRVEKDRTVTVQIDWASAPAGEGKGSITVAEANNRGRAVEVAVRTVRPAGAVSGFAENGRAVTIDAEHASGNGIANGVRWEVLPGFGETLSGMEAFPVTAASTAVGGPQACLDYSFTVFSGGQRSVQAVLAPTLPFVPGRGLRYSVALDGGPAVTVDAWAKYTDEAWRTAVSDGVRKVSSELGEVGAGPHTLHFCRVDAGVVLERLIVYQGAAPATYLGPPESRWIGAASHAGREGKK